MSVTKVKGIALYSANGTRIMGEYYDSRITRDFIAKFETDVVKRALEDPNGMVMQQGDYIVVYSFVDDVCCFIVGDSNPNELILNKILQTVFDTFFLIFKNKVNAQNLTQQIDLVYLTLDEVVDQGVIFETDPEIVAARVMLKSDDAFAGKSGR